MFQIWCKVINNDWRSLDLPATYPTCEAAIQALEAYRKEHNDTAQRDGRYVKEIGGPNTVIVDIKGLGEEVIETEDYKVTLLIQKRIKSKYRVGQVVMTLDHNPKFTGPHTDPQYRIDKSIQTIERVWQGEDKLIWYGFKNTNQQLPEIWMRALRPEEYA